MERKIPTMKLILGSVGVSVALVIAVLVIVLIGRIGFFLLLAVLGLLGIEMARKYFTSSYNINALRFYLLTMLPPIVPFVFYVGYYVYMDNTHWAELEGLLACIILLAWFGVLAVSIGGTLIIAVVRKILSIKATQKAKTNTGDI